MKYSEAGKGSAPRKNADHDAYAKNHEKIFGAVGPLARKKQEEALKNLVEFSEENKLYSEFDCTIEGRKFIKVVSPDNGCGRGLCAATRNGELCENLPECYDQQNFYIFKEVLDK